MATTHRITATAAAILTLAAAAGTPAAAAGSSHASVATATHQKPVTVYSRQDKSLVPVASWSTSDDGVSAGQAAVRIETPASGFDWGDAAVGAAGGFALSMIAVGGALVVSQRHRHGPITPQASRAK